MKRRPRPGDEPELFDLPLSDEPLPPPPVEPPPPEPLPPAIEEEGELPLFSELESDAEEEVAEAFVEEPLEQQPVDQHHVEPSVPDAVPPLARLTSGLFDLGVLVAVGMAVWGGLRWMGIHTTFDDWPAALTFHVAFSFLYFVLPLAFWGRTPGMARAGLVARTPDGAHVSFSQAAARWFGACVTGVFLGVPLLLAVTGRSLSDRLSGSQTLIG